jgi:N4-gp56 family major capsid protein
MANITTSDTSAVSLDIVSQYVQSYLWQNAILVNTILDRSSEATKGVKSIDVGRRSQFSATSKVVDTPLTSQKIVWTADNMTLDKHKVVYTVLEDSADIQAAVAQEPAILESATEALLTSLESEIYTALATTSSATPDHRVELKTHDVVGLADILEARRLLNVANCPMVDRWLAIHPDQERDLLSLEMLTDVSKYGDRMPLINGEIGMLYGFRVVVTNNVTSSTALAYHRTHVAYARQLALNWEKARDLPNAATEYLMQNKFGIKTLDSGKRGILLNNSGS